MNGYYAIHASVSKTDADGWKQTKHLPTFYLHSNVQGILNEAAARRIAHDMVKDVLDITGDETVTIHVHASFIGGGRVMSYNRSRYTPRPKLVTADDIGQHVTLVVRLVPKGTTYVSGVVRDVTATVVTLGVMHHPTGPWDKWESYEASTPIEHKRITRRA